MVLRILTAVLSFAMHGAVVAMLLFNTSNSEANVNAALEEGSGDDQLVIENGIAIESFSKGADDVTMEAVEAPPPVLETVKAEEVKPVEDVQHVVGSEQGPEQQKIAMEPPPEEIKPEEPKPEEKVAVQQPPAVAVDEKRASGEKQDGGKVTALNAYRGKLFNHIAVKKVNPRTTVTGTAKVKFSFDPATGQLLSHEIVESSGSDALDKAALASVERAAPFPPVPVAIAQGAFEVTVPFKFSVR